MSKTRMLPHLRRELDILMFNLVPPPPVLHFLPHLVLLLFILPRLPRRLFDGSSKRSVPSSSPISQTLVSFVLCISSHYQRLVSTLCLGYGGRVVIHLIALCALLPYIISSVISSLVVAVPALIATRTSFRISFPAAGQGRKVEKHYSKREYN